MGTHVDRRQVTGPQDCFQVGLTASHQLPLTVNTQITSKNSFVSMLMLKTNKNRAHLISLHFTE